MRGFLSRPTSARKSTAGVTTGMLVSERANLLRLRALLALGDLELDPLVLFQSAVAARLDGREVDEHVSTPAVDGDEAEALVCVEPLHGSLRHAELSFWKCRPGDARPMVVFEQRHREWRSFKKDKPLNHVHKNWPHCTRRSGPKAAPWTNRVDSG